jgi:hypothetical protein
MTDNGDIPSIQYKKNLSGHKPMRKADNLSLIFIDFYVPTFTPRLKRTETSRQISENIHPFRSVAYIQMSSAKGPRQTLDACDVSFIHLLYNVRDRKEPCSTAACKSLGADIAPYRNS